MRWDIALEWLDSFSLHWCRRSREIENLFLSASIEEVEEADDVAVVQSPHDLKLAVFESLVL